MRNLLSANFSRLWKDRFFWLAMAFMSLGSIALSWVNYNTALKNSEFQVHVEDMMFGLLPILGFVCAFFISLCLGTEFDDHTIRNKLIVGHSRSEIYFAELITCTAATLLLLLTLLLFSGVLGYLLFRTFLLPWTELAYLLLCCLLLTTVFSTMCVGIGMNVHSKAFAVVASTLFLFAILFLASYCGSALTEEPMIYSNVTITVDGVQFGDLVENPAYVDGFQRTVYELIYDILPTGQAIQLNNLEFDRCTRWPILSLLVCVLTTWVGWAGFRNQDIK